MSLFYMEVLLKMHTTTTTTTTTIEDIKSQMTSSHPNPLQLKSSRKVSFCWFVAELSFNFTSEQVGFELEPIYFDVHAITIGPSD